MFSERSLRCISASLAVANRMWLAQADVPLNATYVAGGKLGGWWQQCAPVDAGKAVHCFIWNGGGLVLYDEEFLPYDGGASPTAEELG